MSVNRSIQGTQILDATNPDQGAAVDGSGKVAIQNPSNLDAAVSTLATESKLEAVRSLLQTIDADTGNLDVALSTVATETKLEAVRALLQTIDADTGTIAAVDFATQTTLATLATESKLEAVRVLINSLDGKDYATQTTLAAILVDTGQIETLLTSLDGKDFATQTTLNALLTAFNAEDFATQTTLASLEAKAATETTLDAIRDNIGEAVVTPTADTLMARLQEVIDNLVLIKDTDGIQLIDDIIRLGDVNRAGINSILNNAIRRLEGRSSITSPDGVTDADVGTAATSNNRLSTASRLTDGTGWLSTVVNNSIRRLEGRNSITAPDGSLDVAVITDNSINRLESRSTIVGQKAGTGAETKVTVIDDVEYPTTHKRLQTQALLAPGSTVNIGSSIPADPANLIIEFLTTTGGSENLLVDGSVTPVQFTYAPAAGVTIAVQDVLVVFTADDFEFDGSSFGPNVAMTNGCLFELYTDSVLTPLFTIKQNEDFLRIPGRIPVINNTGPKDLLSAAFVFGGLIKLHGDDGDYVRITVRDNITSTKFKYFTATIYGAEV